MGLSSYDNTKRAKSQAAPLYSRAFTIVELLIVVVVIAILAAITIVSYNGISRSAEESALKSELSSMAKQVSIDKINTGSYPSSLDDYSPGRELTYTENSTNFCISGTANGTSYYISNDTGSPREGGCEEGVSAMQTFSPSQCNALTTYTGSNEEAVITLTDNRGGVTRTYQVAKLADNNCWMLNNLKLGSTSGTVTLTPGDSNVDSNFTLPQIVTSGARDDDNPGAYGPVPGDTGTGATNYGYLYNWPAATAGESRTTHPAGAGNAPNSICPANWRLPTGDTTGEFAMLNAKMNNPSATSPSTSGTGFYQNWQNIGPFKGVFSGLRNTSFGDQGSNGYLWSSSAHASNANNAHSTVFFATYVLPGNSSGNRYSGFGVRCLLD